VSKNNTFNNTFNHSPLGSKQPLRQVLLAQRQTISEAQKHFRQTAGVKKLIQQLQEKYSHICIAIYYPYAAEPNILGLLTDLQSDNAGAGYSFALPVVVNKNQALQFAKYCTGDSLIKSTYGILVPECIQWVVPNLILMPCLGYQRTANGIYRLGYGGGYYDRTLAQLFFDADFLGSIAVAWRESSCYFDVDVFDKKADHLLLM
jgi:5-formyltetrahydrofolate cyclo-ligase